MSVGVILPSNLRPSQWERFFPRRQSAILLGQIQAAPRRACFRSAHTFCLGRIPGVGARAPAVSGLAHAEVAISRRSSEIITVRTHPLWRPPLPTLLQDTAQHG